MVGCTYAGIGGDGNRDWWIQDKYTSFAAPIRLVDWQEMELIKAEAKHAGSDLAGAIEHINNVRAAALDDTAGVALEPRPSNSDANEVGIGLSMSVEWSSSMKVEEWLIVGISGSSLSSRTIRRSSPYLHMNATPIPISRDHL